MRDFKIRDAKKTPELSQMGVCVCQNGELDPQNGLVLVDIKDKVKRVPSKSYKRIDVDDPVCGNPFCGFLRSNVSKIEGCPGLDGA